MGWTEDLFQKAESWLSRIDQQRRGLEPSGQAVHFKSIKNFLSLWTALVSGRSWALQESEGWPATDGERLFFPPVLDIFADESLNRKAYLYMACLMTGNDESRFPELILWRRLFQNSEYKLKEREITGAVQILKQQDYVKPIAENSMWTPDCFRSLMNLWLIRVLPRNVHSRQNNADQPSKGANTPDAHHKKKAKEQIQVIESFDSRDNENPLVHSFEKLHTADDYNGGQKKQDGENEIEEHAAALDELDLRQVIRSQQETRATLKGDYVMDLDVAPSQDFDRPTNDEVHMYDEWDEDKACYHLNWCRLEVKKANSIQNPSNEFDLEKIKKNNRSKVDQLIRQFYSLFKSPRWKSRQLDGAELDLEALVDMMGTPIEKRPERMKVYLSRQKDFNELSVILLFDRSLSSDSWVHDRRILDIIRESFVVTGEALKRFALPVQLAAFSSQTRNKISYEVLKDFHEDWNSGLERIGSVEPQGYTRIGPALRHAASLLQKRKAKHKWIILLSDSKPTDFDKYEGRYGIRDVRKAIQEARLQNIGIRCLSIDKDHRSDLAEMYGQRGYEILSQVEQLPERLGGILRSLVELAK